MGSSSKFGKMGVVVVATVAPVATEFEGVSVGIDGVSAEGVGEKL